MIGGKRITFYNFMMYYILQSYFQSQWMRQIWPPSAWNRKKGKFQTGSVWCSDESGKKVSEDLPFHSVMVLEILLGQSILVFTCMEGGWLLWIYGSFWEWNGEILCSQIDDNLITF